MDSNCECWSRMLQYAHAAEEMATALSLPKPRSLRRTSASRGAVAAKNYGVLTGDEDEAEWVALDLLWALDHARRSGNPILCLVRAMICLVKRQVGQKDWAAQDIRVVEPLPRYLREID